MSGNLPIVLIVVMWIFVLAPLLLRGQKPIRRANKALEETRVVYEGGSGTINVPRRRPRFTKSDIHREDAEVSEDYELVGSYELEDNLDDEEGASASEQSSADNTEAEAVLDGEVLAESGESVAVRVDASMLEDLTAADSSDTISARPAKKSRASAETHTTSTRPTQNPLICFTPVSPTPTSSRLLRLPLLKIATRNHRNSVPKKLPSPSVEKVAVDLTLRQMPR